MNRLSMGLLILGAVCMAHGQDGDWMTSWEKAAKVAKQTGKPVLAEFTGSDWCHPCQAFDKRVFQTDVFKGWAKQHVVLLRLDFPRYKKQPAALANANNKMQEKYRIGAFPTVLFLKPSGDIIGGYGYSGEGPSFWTKNAELIMASASHGR